MAPETGHDGRDTGDVLPLVSNEEWAERFPWLVQATTARGGTDPAFDLGLAGREPVAAVLGRWNTVREALGADGIVVARQVHGDRVLEHSHTLRGMHIAEAADGHVTGVTGLLLAVTIADCVPVFLARPRDRRVALLHAGWRGVAGRILQAGLAGLGPGSTEDIFVHFGPAICGTCYEVGPEVHRALGRSPPTGPETIDLRAILAEQAEAAGVPRANISRSAWCTRCDAPHFFSHRGGDAGRQIGVIGIRRAG